VRVRTLFSFRCVLFPCGASHRMHATSVPCLYQSMSVCFFCRHTMSAFLFCYCFFIIPSGHVLIGFVVIVEIVLLSEQFLAHALVAGSSNLFINHIVHSMGCDVRTMRRRIQAVVKVARGRVTQKWTWSALVVSDSDGQYVHLTRLW
jgi:hypothetical protein